MRHREAPSARRSVSSAARRGARDEEVRDVRAGDQQDDGDDHEDRGQGLLVAVRSGTVRRPRASVNGSVR
jgi:hypothetical protein